MMHDSRLLRSLLVMGLAMLMSACETPVDLSQRAPTAPATMAGTRLAYNGGNLWVGRAGGSCQIRIEGEINGNTAMRLHQAFAELDKGPCRDKTVVLDVNHGEVGSAVTVGSMLRNRSFATRVASGSACLTSCWLVFVGGVDRAMEPGARLGFSQIPPDEEYARRQCETELSRGQALTITRYLRAMLPPAPASALFQRVAVANCRSTVYWSAAEAQANGVLGSSAM